MPLVSQRDEILFRFGTSRESASRLARKAQEALQIIGIHGVSVSATPSEILSSCALRAEIEAHFAVHNTARDFDPLHRTIELPQPVTQKVANTFNRLFGR